MEILLPLLALMGVFGTDPAAPPASRQAALYTVLERAEMLYEASNRRRAPGRNAYFAPGRDASDARRRDAFDAPGRDASEEDAERELQLDLMHMELAAGYLASTCVYDGEAVTRMRMMIAYVGLLRLVGEPDRAIVSRLVEAAGPEGERVGRLLDFAGLDGISHFICADYMGEALAAGMSTEDIRAYVDLLDPPPPAAPPLPPNMRIAAVN